MPDSQHQEKEQKLTKQNNNEKVIALNISRALRHHDNVAIEAALHTRMPDSLEQRQHLASADIILAVANNVVRGVFRVIDAEVISEPVPGVGWDLQAIPAYSGLVGVNISSIDGPHWQQGKSVAFIDYSKDLLDKLQKEARKGSIALGTNKVQLLPTGDVLIELAPGQSVQVINAEKPPTLKHRIEPIVKALGLTKALTTYGTIAEALHNKPQPVATSIVGNANISPLEGARVLPNKYYDAKRDCWVIPSSDELTSQDGNKYSRGALLESEGLVATKDGNDYIVHPDDVIIDAVSLRQFLLV